MMTGVTEAIQAGQRFGRWVALHQYQMVTGKLECRCDCGTMRLVNVHNLREGATRSCGCLKRDTAKGNSRNLKHRKTG